MPCNYSWNCDPLFQEPATTSQLSEYHNLGCRAAESDTGTHGCYEGVIMAEWQQLRAHDFDCGTLQRKLDRLLAKRSPTCRAGNSLTAE